MRYSSLVFIQETKLQVVCEQTVELTEYICLVSHIDININGSPFSAIFMVNRSTFDK